MKILMYAPIFPPAIGGPSTQCYSLCQTLHSKSEKVVVVTVGEHFEQKSPDGYPVYRYPWKYTGTFLDKPLRWIMFPFYFGWILSKEKPDIVHCHSVSVLSFMAACICKLYGVPTVLKFAGDWVWETLSTSGVKAKDFDDLRERSALARLMWRFEKWGLSLFDTIWVPSEFRAQNVLDVQGHKKNVKVIYNALGLPEGGYYDKQEGDPFVLFSASRFIPHKRISLIIKTFAALKNPSAKLVLFGSTDNELVLADAKAVVKKEGIESQVAFFIRKIKPEDYQYFREASAYISLSLEEGFPNVFVEAMHFGLPIISTDVGGCHEIVREGETGFLVDINDEQAMVDRVKRLMNDVELRNQMGRSAYEYSRQYELATVIEQFMDLYRSALAKK